MAHLATLEFVQSENNFSTAVTEFQKQVEQQANAIAPDPLFDYIYAAYRDFATVTARQLNQL